MEESHHLGGEPHISCVLIVWLYVYASVYVSGLTLLMNTKENTSKNIDKSQL